MFINRANLADLFVAFNAAFKTGFGRATPQWQLIAMLTNSTTSEELYAWLGQFPRLREWLGERLIKQMAAHDYRIKNKSFEATVEVDRDALEDDKYGVYTPLFDEMGYAAATHPDELVFALLKAGFSTACYDGQYYFDSDHPVGREVKTSVTNVQTGSGDPWFLMDLSRAMKPLIFQRRKQYEMVAVNKPEDESVFMTKKFKYGVDGRCNVGFGLWQLAFGSKAALTEANFESAYSAMQSFKSDEGAPLGVKPTHLVCGPTNRSAALKIVRDFSADGASNPNRAIVEVVSTPWLA